MSQKHLKSQPFNPDSRCHSNTGLKKCLKNQAKCPNLGVVYFDQRTHACACVRMVENDQKHSKMSKKVPFSSCVREAYKRLTNKNEEKSLLVSDWE